MTPVSRVTSAALYNFINVFVSAKTTKCNACLECSSLFLKSRSLIFILFSFACTSTSRRALVSTSSLTLTNALAASNSAAFTRSSHRSNCLSKLCTCIFIARFSEIAADSFRFNAISASVFALRTALSAWNFSSSADFNASLAALCVFSNISKCKSAACNFSSVNSCSLLSLSNA